MLAFFLMDIQNKYIQSKTNYYNNNQTQKNTICLTHDDY